MTVDSATRADAVHAIANVKARYCMFTDQHRWSEFAELFTEDATFDLSEMHFAVDARTGHRIPDPRFSDEFLDVSSGATLSEWPIVGRSAIQKYCSEGSRMMRFSHHVFVPEIEVVTATTARAVWPMEDRIWFDAGAPFASLHGIGHYHETYCADGGQWRIRSCRLTRQKVVWE